MDQIVCDHLKLDAPAADMTEWRALEEKVLNLKKKTKLRWLVNMLNYQMPIFLL